MEGLILSNVLFFPTLELKEQKEIRNLPGHSASCRAGALIGVSEGRGGVLGTTQCQVNHLPPGNLARAVVDQRDSKMSKSVREHCHCCGQERSWEFMRLWGGRCSAQFYAPELPQNLSEKLGKKLWMPAWPWPKCCLSSLILVS